MTEPRSPDDGVRLEATASGHATVSQAGRDLHVHFGAGARRVIPAMDGADVGCPYPGLAPFTADQAGWFFGRDRVTAGLLSRLDASLTGGGPVIVVAGSGAGKSSLLRAGLLPRIADGGLTPAGSRHWPRVVFTPGAHPMRAAAGALQAALPAGSDVRMPPDPDAGELDGLLAAVVAVAGPGTRAVLVVDQLEELFRLCEDEDERGAFISWLWRAARGEAPGGPAVLAACAVRADFYPDCTRFPDISQALQDNQVIIGAMSPEELREAVTCPAEAAGLDIEPGLTELLLADLRAAPPSAAGGNMAEDDGAGRLPLLAHALRVTWQQRHGSTLTVDGYRATGGIEHAIADSAERVFAGLDTAAKREARGLFLRLVKIGATSGEDVRRPAPRLSFAGGNLDEEAVIDAYTAARLLAQSLGTVQITHEALLRAWPRLAGWLDDDRAGQLARQRTEDDAAEWDQAGRDASRLYRGARLETAAAQAGSRSPGLTAAARDFIAASRRRARRTTLVQRGAIAVLAVLLLIVSVTSAVAVIQRSAAVGQSRVALSEDKLAQAEARTSESEAMAANAVNLLSADAPLAMLLSLQAYERAPTYQATSALIEAAQQPLDELLTGKGPADGAAFSPDGHTLAVADDDGDIDLWNVATGQETATLADGDPVYSVAFSPDGRTLAAADSADDISLWNVATGQRTATLNEGTIVTSMAFSPDGRTLAAGDDVGDVGDISLWDVATGRRTAVLADGSAVDGVAFSPDGRTLAAADYGGDISLWSVANRRRAAVLAEGSPANSVAFSPDGRALTVGDDGGDISLWDVATGRRTAVLTDGSSVYSAAFAPDGRTLAAGDEDGDISLWDVATGRRTAVLADGSSVNTVAFSPDGRTLAASSEGGGTSLWNPASAQQANVTAGTPLNSVAFTQDGRFLAAAAGGDISLWSVATGQRAAVLADGSPVNTVAFSPDGRTLAAGDEGGETSLWDVATGRRTAVLPFGDAVYSVAFSPDGRTLAAGGADGTGGIILWNVATGQRTATLNEGNGVTSVAFSPDGRTLAVGDELGGVSLWDVASGRQTATLEQAGTTDTDMLVNSVAFSPDGRTLAVGDDDGDISLWSVATRREEPSPETAGSPVKSVAFSPGPDPVLMAGDLFGNVSFWNPANRQMIASVPETGGGVVGLAFPASGQLLAIGTGNGSVTLLRQDPAELTQQYFTHLICGKVRGNMTVAQWAEYAPGQPYQKTCP